MLAVGKKRGIQQRPMFGIDDGDDGGGAAGLWNSVNRSSRDRQEQDPAVAAPRSAARMHGVRKRLWCTTVEPNALQLAVREVGERPTVGCPERLIRVSVDLGARQQARIRNVEPPVPQHDAAPLVRRPERDLGAIGRNGRRRERREAAVWGRERNPRCGRRRRGTTARPPNQPAARRPIPIALPAIHADAGRREPMGMDTGADPDDTADPESDSSANATSRALWKRSLGFFSRQCRMIRSSAGGRSIAIPARSGGS